MSLVSILLVDVHSVVYRKPTSTTIENLQEPQTYKYYSLSKTYKYYRKPTVFIENLQLPISISTGTHTHQQNGKWGHLEILLN